MLVGVLSRRSNGVQSLCLARLLYRSLYHLAYHAVAHRHYRETLADPAQIGSRARPVEAVGAASTGGFGQLVWFAVLGLMVTSV